MTLEGPHAQGNGEGVKVSQCDLVMNGLGVHVSDLRPTSHLVRTTSLCNHIVHDVQPTSYQHALAKILCLALPLTCRLHLSLSGAAGASHFTGKLSRVAASERLHVTDPRRSSTAYNSTWPTAT